MAIDMTKRTEAAEAGIISLLKREAERGIDLGEITAQVVLVVDFSGSMDERYCNGEVQATVERALAMSLAGLDDDGVVPVVFFHHDAFAPIEVTRDNYQGFVQEFVRRNSMGATNYVPAINTVLEVLGHRQKPGWFGRRKGATSGSPLPAFVIFVTDGEPSDKSETMSLLANVSNKPVFWQFLGLGYSPRFLQQLDTMSGRLVDNVGLTEMSATRDMNDQAWHTAVLDEYITSWTPAARQAGIIPPG